MSGGGGVAEPRPTIVAREVQKRDSGIRRPVWARHVGITGQFVLGARAWFTDTPSRKVMNSSPLQWARESRRPTESSGATEGADANTCPMGCRPERGLAKSSPPRRARGIHVHTHTQACKQKFSPEEVTAYSMTMSDLTCSAAESKRTTSSRLSPLSCWTSARSSSKDILLDPRPEAACGCELGAMTSAEGPGSGAGADAGAAGLRAAAPAASSTGPAGALASAGAASVTFSLSSRSRCVCICLATKLA